MAAPHDPSSGRPPGKRLESWKEIAHYLNRKTRTVQRWEKSEGLPVHRHGHELQATVYAYTAELDLWQENRRITPAAPPAVLPRRSPAWALVGIALVLAAALATSTGRNIGRVLPFKERDWVLLDPFENRTGEPLLDGALRNALERELSNSTYFSVTPRERVEDTLRLMRKPPDTKLDASLAREVCLRDGGIRAVITGKAEKLGSAYVFSVELIDPVQDRPVASSSETAAGQDHILAAIRRLSNWVRESLGEAMDRIELSNRQLEKVTTPSLHASQLFAEADQASRHQQWAVSAQLTRQAVAEDPNFASAHTWLAWALKNLGDAGWKAEAQRAMDLAGTVSERERYFIVASYYMMTDQPEQAIPVLEALTRIYPDHYYGNANLTEAYQRTRNSIRAREVAASAADLRPNDYLTNARATLIVLPYDVHRGGHFAARARTLAQMLPPGNIPLDMEVMFSKFDELWLQGDPAGALEELHRLERLPNRQHWSPWMATRYLVLGRLRDNEKWIGLEAEYNNAASQSIVAVNRTSNGTDNAKTREALETMLRLVPLDSIRSGLLCARFNIPHWSDYIVDSGLDEGRRTGFNGALALQKGQTMEAVSAFKKSFDWFVLTGGYPVPSAEGLSLAWEQAGDLQKAAETLEQFSTVRIRHPTDYGVGWLRNQARLAVLYRKLGRNQDARKIEDELRKLMAVADPDHAIVRQLRKP